MTKNQQSRHRKRNLHNPRAEWIIRLQKLTLTDLLNENMDEIDKLIQEADAAGYELDADAMIDAIASGEYKDFDAIRATLK